MRRLIVFLLAIAPITIDWLYKVVIRPRPFWVHFYDPEALHFFQALKLWRGQLPENFDNPGTPIQLIGAAIIGITGATPLRYEPFLAVMHVVGLLFTLAAIWLLLATILRDAPTPLQLAAAWSFFLAPQALERSDVYSPELFFFPFAALAMVMLWRWRERGDDRWLFFLGAAVGLCVATKLVFISWAVATIAAALATRSIKRVALAVAGLGTGFVVSTLPLALHYPELVTRILGLARRESEQTWPELLINAKGWWLWLLIVAAMAVFAGRKASRPLTPILVFAITSFITNYLGALRSPSFRYLLPAALAVTLLVAACASAVAWPRWASIAVATVAALLVTKSVLSDLASHRLRVDSGLALKAAIDAAVPDNAVVLYSWRVPQPSFALRQMTLDPRDLDEIATRHPREGHFNIWVRRVFLPRDASDWDYLVIQPEDLATFPQSVGQVAARVDRYLIVQRR